MAFRRTSGSNLAAHDVDVEGAVKLSATSTPKRVNRVAVTVSAVAIAAAATVGVVAHSLAPAGTPTVHSEDVALTAGADTAAIDASVKAILDGISYTGAGGATEYIGTSSLSNVLEYAFPSLNLQLGEVFSLVGLNDPTAADPTSGITTTVNELLNALNLGQLTPINDFLALLPVGSGDPVITGETTLGVILTDLQVPAPDGGSGTIDLGNVTINEILASFTLPGGGTLSDATTLGMLLNDYPSIANISLTGLLGGLSGGGSEGGLGGILSGLLGDLGGLGGVPTTVGGLVSTLGLDDDTIGSLLGFTSTTDLSDIASQLNIDGYSLDSILADLPSNGVTLTGASTLDQITDFFGVGGKTLAELIPGGADLTNNSTIVDLLNDTALFGNLGQQTIDSLLGLTSATAGEAAASLTASGSDVAASLF